METRTDPRTRWLEWEATSFRRLLERITTRCVLEFGPHLDLVEMDYYAGEPPERWRVLLLMAPATTAGNYFFDATTNRVHRMLKRQLGAPSYHEGAQ
jgi:hypothetical protein